MIMRKTVVFLLIVFLGISCTLRFDDAKTVRPENTANETTKALTLSLSIHLGPSVGHASDNRLEDGFDITEDIVPIINGDVEQAKNMAITGAMRKALEKKEINIVGETLIGQGLTVADSTWVLVEGFIKAWELLESGVVDGNGYRVKVKCWVKSGRDLKKEATNVLSFLKVLFIADNPAEKAVERVLSTELRNTLMSGALKHLRSHDSEFVKNNVSPAAWQQLIDRQLYDLEPDAYRFEANEPKPCLVIHIQSSLVHEGTSDTLKMEKYSAQAEARLFQLSGDRKGEAIIDATIDSDKLFVKSSGGQDAQSRRLLTSKHPNAFRKQIAEPVAAIFMEQLMNCKQFAVPDRTVTVVIHDVPTPAEYEKFLYIVKKQRGVNDRVKQVAQNGHAYTLEVQFPMKSIYLANLISQDRKYEKIGHRWNRIEFRYRKTGG